MSEVNLYILHELERDVDTPTSEVQDNFQLLVVVGESEESSPESEITDILVVWENIVTKQLQDYKMTNALKKIKGYTGYLKLTCYTIFCSKP